MSIVYSPKYLTALNSPNRHPSTYIEIDLGGSTVRWGNNKIMAGLVHPVLKSISKQHNKLDIKQNIVTKGSLSFSVIESSYIRAIIVANRLKNLRVKRYDGFIADGWDDTDYIKTFEGVIYDISKSGEIWNFKARDIREQTQVAVPTAKTDRTHYIDYSDFNPIDIMTDLIETQSGIAGADYDGAQFNSERDLWYNTWIFFRVLVDSKPAGKHLEELQVETNGYIYNDGDKISFKSFAPTVPGATVREFSDDYNLIAGATSSDLGYVDDFFNRVEVHFDYDESGNNKEENFESMFFAEDTDSQTDWGEIKKKVIKAKWIRSFSFDQPVDFTGCVVYAASKDNGAGAGTLTYNFANKTAKWQALGDSIGSAITVDRSGKYQVKSADERKYVRIIIDTALTPGSNKSDSITLSAISGPVYAEALAIRLLNRYLDPVATVKGQLDYRDISNDGVMYSPTDMVNITTDEVASFGKENFDAEPCILLSIKPDESRQRIAFEAMPTRLGKKGMFIAPSGFPVYEFATASQREYWFIGRASDNKVFDGVDFVRGANTII